ncbi:tyrosine-type recombinase/integrase [Sphingomonas sp. SORGH_AS_0879]|uniref:tyrosine-type recombinase/integrase n=1 Tax=Sphingomonas sp. SORGH_AS_0879 TaxID=3041790 RepID=UPI003593C3E4
MNTGIFTKYGNRKYLTASEVEHFISATRKYSIEVRAFCLVMAFTGCRISEALSLTTDSIDFVSEQVVIRCLKKRGRTIFRAIPLPSNVIKILKRWFDQRPANKPTCYGHGVE